MKQQSFPFKLHRTKTFARTQSITKRSASAAAAVATALQECGFFRSKIIIYFLTFFFRMGATCCPLQGKSFAVSFWPCNILFRRSDTLRRSQTTWGGHLKRVGRRKECGVTSPFKYFALFFSRVFSATGMCTYPLWTNHLWIHFVFRRRTTLAELKCGGETKKKENKLHWTSDVECGPVGIDFSALSCSFIRLGHRASSTEHGLIVIEFECTAQIAAAAAAAAVSNWLFGRRIYPFAA